MSDIEPTRAASRLTMSAVAVLVLTNVHHVYGATVYRTPWRLHVLLLTVPAIFAILASRRRLVQRPASTAARWTLLLTTLLVPVLGIGAFEGFYNHVVKDLLFFHGASTELMTRLFPPSTHEMPNDAFFEITGVATAFLGAMTAAYLYRFATRERDDAHSRGSPAVVRPRTLTTIAAEPVPVPDAKSLVHLQFRRFAGCPVCNLHLSSFKRRDGEIREAHVREVVVFHSAAAELRDHAADLPFAVIADPDRALYTEFGVERSLRALLDPRAWGAIVLGVTRSLLRWLRGAAPLPALSPEGGGLGLPADFLIAPDGRVVASKYGAHADDQWSVDEVLALARTATCVGARLPLELTHEPFGGAKLRGR